MKILWLDVETTGLDTNIHSVIELSGIIEIDGEVKETFQIFSKPYKGAMINKQALSITNKTIEELHSYQEHIQAHKELVDILQKYIDKYNRKDKFILGGFNTHFDFKFLLSFFEHANDKYCGSYISYTQRIDVYHILEFLRAEKYITTDNGKLQNYAQYFNIDIISHNALSDITATRDIYKILKNRITYTE